MTPILGQRRKIEPQYKAIYTKRLVERGMSKVLREVDALVDSDHYDIVVAAGTVLKLAPRDHDGAHDLATGYQHKLHEARKKIDHLFKQHKDWSSKENDFLKQLLKEIDAHLEDWTLLINRKLERG